MHRVTGALLLALLLGATGGAPAAETRYVSDRIEVTLRTGQSTQHKVRRTLMSGTEVELLETDSDTGYSRVRTEDGTEGWMLTRYLARLPSARDRLAVVEKRLAELKMANRELEARLDELAAERARLTEANDRLAEARDRLQGEVETIRRNARDALDIVDENERLERGHAALEERVRELEHEAEALRSRTRRDWFLTGAGVLAGGLALGLVLPRLRRRRGLWGEW
ncbi:MAG: TIGR04211 family SH3 domain-containing protein [Gammaproteobacteria bacterium]|nr:TIGR04211 family SH3 domain-containing protein [Gammaproteobacteria bacterium]